MKVFVRFILPVIVALAVIAYATVPVVTHFTERWFHKDLELRTSLITASLQQSITQTSSSHVSENSRKIQHMIDTAVSDESIIGLAICNHHQKMWVRSSNFPEYINCPKTQIRSDSDTVVGENPVRLSNVPLSLGKNLSSPTQMLMIIHDRSLILKRAADTRYYVWLAFLITALTVGTLTFAVAQWSNYNWVFAMRRLLRSILHRRDFGRVENTAFLPIVQDLRLLVKDFQQTQEMRDEARTTWDAKAIREILSRELLGDEVIVVSNREPYSHVRRNGTIEVQSPASGLVTAVEPIMRACSGTWIAHGSGSADKETVNKYDRVRVPPEKPEYDLHRLWLTKEEEDRYYYGFANEGLWPLCHIAYTRPIFRAEDWLAYVEVNRKFADAVIADAKQDDPVVLVQDYHFALVPRFIREKLPNATIITFWHIPWPNAESFGICPWQKEILEGLLGSSIIGFHTQFHCNNFIECVDRVLESRIDRETNSISYQGNLSAVRPYPISIEWQPSKLADVGTVEVCRQKVCEEFSLAPDAQIAVGIDRLDYTKGIIERFRAVEHLLEHHQAAVGRFALVQIAAPSRSSIKAYKTFHDDVVEMAARINRKFGTETYLPIRLVIEHREPNRVLEYLRACDVCMVTSLHDGMNLVAKEFIAARNDELGVLILSEFTGASRELVDALIVNPYNVEQTATALFKALTMSLEEQRERMRIMRMAVKEYNVFRWAGRMLLDASVLRRRQHFSKNSKRASKSKGAFIKRFPLKAGDRTLNFSSRAIS